MCHDVSMWVLHGNTMYYLIFPATSSDQELANFWRDWAPTPLCQTMFKACNLHLLVEETPPKEGLRFAAATPERASKIGKTGDKRDDRDLETPPKVATPVPNREKRCRPAPYGQPQKNLSVMLMPADKRAKTSTKESTEARKQKADEECELASDPDGEEDPVS